LNAAGLESRIESAKLALGSLAPGHRVHWWAGLTFDHLALDLAIQDAGAVSAPWRVNASPANPASRSETWFRIGTERPAAGDRVWFPMGEKNRLPPVGRDSFRVRVGGVEVGGPLGGGFGEAWSREEHRQRSSALGSRLEPAPGESSRRDIVVLHRPLCEPGARLLSTWALSSGAALLVEPDSELWLSSAAWARPTVLAATGEEFAESAAWVAGSKVATLLRRGGPFGRLRRLLVLDGEAEDLAEAWCRLRVRAAGAQ
jgi:hypothetical protein